MLGLLGQGWSPEQVVGRLQREAGHPVIGCETIYRFIYAQLRTAPNDGAYAYHYLPRAKARRGRRRKKITSPALLIKHRVPVHERPP